MVPYLDQDLLTKTAVWGGKGPGGDLRKESVVSLGTTGATREKY